MFYYEQKDAFGIWHPRSAAVEPTPRSSEGKKLHLRNVKFIKEKHRGKSLDDLWRHFNRPRATHGETSMKTSERGSVNVNATIAELVQELLAGNVKRLGVNGFGSFKIADVTAKTGRNLKTGEPVDIPAHRTIRFKLSPSLKTRLNAQSGLPAGSD